MCMCEQMILAILIVAVTFRAVTELQARIIQFCPSTDSAFVFCPILIYVRGTLRPLYLLLVFSFPLHLFRRIRIRIPCAHKEEQDIYHGYCAFALPPFPNGRK